MMKKLLCVGGLLLLAVSSANAEKLTPTEALMELNKATGKVIRNQMEQDEKISSLEKRLSFLESQKNNAVQKAPVVEKNIELDSTISNYINKH